MQSLLLMQAKFLSTLSLRRATEFGLYITGILPISIHALLAESDFVTRIIIGNIIISIHALLAESDQQQRLYWQ